MAYRSMSKCQGIVLIPGLIVEACTGKRKDTIVNMAKCPNNLKQINGTSYLEIK